MFESSRTTPLVFYRVGIFVWSVVCLVISFKLSAFCSASLDGFSVLFSKRCFYFLEIEHIYIFEQSVKYTINDIQHILSIDAKTVLDCFTKVYFSIVHSDWSTTHIEEMIAISWCVIKNHPQLFHCPSKLSQSLRSPKVANKRNSSRDESSEHLLRDLRSIHRLGILDKKRIIGRTSASMFRPIPDCDDHLNLQVLFIESYLTV